MFSRLVEPQAHAELAAPTEGDVLVSTGVGPRGEVVALWSSAAGREALPARDGGPGRPSFAATRTERPVEARLTGHGPERDVVVTLDPALARPVVQPLPDDRFLVVGARCRWRPEGAEHNAQVVGPDGDVVRTAVFGDGVNHVATTPTGQAWVAYSDEGVYGNYGWGGQGTAAPVGTSGLVRFDPALKRAWSYPLDGDFDAIDDCYSLNVAGETAWACYYSDFPVVRVDGDRVTG
ncbi:hypothetical protein LZG04_17425 [Saccharothrix sp. S26]|uniref:hypothetical protein n=1 Tax=Saccharothrix sp. S26 TaxID=2907215 RepID=UPI001F360B7D|nr:hypothetical protein [Saccharothrix sp. S26]MCE6996569.1 hypothetical protein [Saccharothrix sp. S26]